MSFICLTIKSGGKSISTSFFKFRIFMTALRNINLNSRSLNTKIVANLVNLTDPCIQLHFNSSASWRHYQDGTTHGIKSDFLALFVSVEMPKVSFRMDLLETFSKKGKLAGTAELWGGGGRPNHFLLQMHFFMPFLEHRLPNLGYQICHS